MRSYEALPTSKCFAAERGETLAGYTLFSGLVIEFQCKAFDAIWGCLFWGLGIGMREEEGGEEEKEEERNFYVPAPTTKKTP